jgi:DNA modification methylase
MNAIAMPAAIEHLPIDALVPYARNSRTHSDAQVAQVAASIREFGFTNPVLIDDAGGIIAGHGRVMAARSVGLDTVPCIRLGHLSEAQRRAYVIADNKLALNAGWDEALLAAELRDLAGFEFDLNLTGFMGDEIDALLASEDARASRSDKDPDEAPAPAAREVSRPGEVWILGKHRLGCLDGTDAAAWPKVMRADKAAVCWTDPPYNVAYVGEAGSIDNDDMSDADFLEFQRTLLRNVAAVMKSGAAIYVAHADNGETGISFRRAFIDAGFKLAACLVWRKDSLVMGRADYQWIHEPILYGWKTGAGHTWHGGRKQVSLTALGSSESPFVQLPDGRWKIEIGEEILIVDGSATVEWVEGSVLREVRPKRNDLHPTMKPVALIERMLRNNAKPGQVVIDPCGGSGSTLIAAERQGMSARLLEISPRFVDVIIRRWQEFSGGGATLEGDGRTFAQIAAERGA